MKKLLVLLLCAALALSSAACGETVLSNSPTPGGTDSGAGVPNPVAPVESAADFTKLGIVMDAPEGASEVSYAVIAGDVAQAEFRLNEFEYTYRASKKRTDIAGVYDTFTDSFAFSTAFDSGVTLEATVQNTASGGRLARWANTDVSYTLWCAGSPDDGTLKACALGAMEKTFGKMQPATQPTYYEDFTGQKEFDIDLDGDGKAEHVSLLPTLSSDGYTDWITLSVASDGGAEDTALLPLMDDPSVVFAVDLHADGLVELFISGDVASSDYETWVFRYDRGKLTAAASEEKPDWEDEFVPPSAYGEIVTIEDAHNILIENVVDILGSWWCVTKMELDPQSFSLKRTPGSAWQYMADRNDAFGEDGMFLETVREFPVMLAGNPDATLPVGTKLIPFETNGKDYLRFITKDGLMGVINVTFDEESWEFFIDGVNASELFVSLPYAG